jgi:hypothetical protein
MNLTSKKLGALVATALLSIVGVGAISAPARAADCPYPVTDQTTNDHPKDTIRLISPVLTDDNSIHRYDFESQFTVDCDWFGVGMHFNQVYVPFGLRTNLTFHAANAAGAPLANTVVTLRANKGYSNSNAAVRVNGIKARPAPANASDGANVQATTDANGNVTFVISSPDDCTTYGGVLPDAPLHLDSDTPNDKYTDPTTDCYSQFLPSITGEKTDTADFIELHYYNTVSYATTTSLAQSFSSSAGEVQSAVDNSGKLTLSIVGGQTPVWAATNIDGQAVKVGDRLLVKNESVTSRNGLYVVTKAGTLTNSVSFEFTRSADLSTSTQFNDLVPLRTEVLNGAINQGKVFSLVSPPKDSELGVAALAWEESFAPVASTKQLGLLAPTLDGTNSISGNGVVQAYAPLASKQIIAFQALNEDDTYARNQAVSVRINLANSGANAKISAGIVGNSALGSATTLSNADATKTTEDQLVLTGTTDAFGIVTFTLNNTDTTGEAAPATKTTPVPVSGGTFAKVFAELTGVTTMGNAVEFHYYKPSLPITVSATAAGKKISVTIKNAIGKSFQVTVTGLKKVTVKPTKATQVYTYIVKKGSKTVTVSADGRTLTKKFLIK